MKSWFRHQEENDSEKQSLRSHVRKRGIPCLIRNRKALAFFTRLVFTLTIFTGFGVIFASIWFMLDCRENFSSIQALIPKHSTFCTNLGMQALFACCVLLFTIFGLGCIGRRMTGHAILIISGVAIFQGSMTIVFYQCRAMADDDIVKAVNSTLESCRVGTRSPFASLSFSDSDVAETMTPASKRDLKTEPTTKFLPEKDGSNDGDGEEDLELSSQSPNSRDLHVNSSRFLQLIDRANQDLKRKLQDSIKAVENDKTHYTSIPIETVDCSTDMGYFVEFAGGHDQKQVETCLKVCRTYRNFCLGREVNADGQKLTDTGEERRKSDDQPEAGTDFRSHALACGEEITGYVRHFCMYDNRIFTPLSLGTPIFYMFMSFCFIYLAHCDRRIKEDDPLSDSGNSRKSRSRSSQRKSSRRSRSKGEDAREGGYSSSSPTKSQGQDESTVASPAQSVASCPWGHELGLGRELFTHESDNKAQASIQSTSTRTFDTFLGDED